MKPARQMIAMKKKHIKCRYLTASLLLLAILIGCGKDRNETSDKDITSMAGVSSGNASVDMDAKSVQSKKTPGFRERKIGGRCGEISVSKDGKTIYVHNWVDISQLSDKRTTKAEKIVFYKDAGIRVDWDTDYINQSWLHDAPLVKELEVEEGNPYLYAVDDMLVQRAGAGYDEDSETELETLMLCVPGKSGEIRIPEGVQSVYEHAFLGCSLITSVFFPASVETVGNAAFGKMKSCVSIQADEDNQYYDSQGGVLYGKALGASEYACIAAYPAGRKDAVYEKEPEYIEEIQEGAFFGADHLREVYLPSRVRFIRSAAFQKCKNLRKVTVKNKKRISVVEGSAFEDCPRLKEWVKEKGKL